MIHPVPPGDSLAALYAPFVLSGGTDLEPFRAIRADALRRLEKCDTAYGWAVEMQIKTIQAKLRMTETAVYRYRRRFGKSRVGPGLNAAHGNEPGLMRPVANRRFGSRWRKVRVGPSARQNALRRVCMGFVARRAPGHHDDG